jgi:hypothetical protein
MLNAIETLPFSEADRRASEEALGKLVRGAEVPRVPTRSLPPMPDLETVILAPPQPPPRRRRAALWGTGIAVAAAGLGGLAVALGAFRQDAPTEALTTSSPSPTDSARANVPVATVAAPQPRPTAPAAPGTLRVLVNPASAEILVDGRVVGVGSAVDLAIPSGRRRLALRATGYMSFDTAVTVAPGALVNLGRVVLRPRSGS